MEGELGERTTRVGRLETEVEKLRKTVDQAKGREQKLAKELREVLVARCVIVVAWVFFRGEGEIMTKQLDALAASACAFLCIHVSEDKVC